MRLRGAGLLLALSLASPALASCGGGGKGAGAGQAAVAPGNGVVAGAGEGAASGSTGGAASTTATGSDTTTSSAPGPGKGGAPAGTGAGKDSAPAGAGVGAAGGGKGSVGSTGGARVQPKHGGAHRGTGGGTNGSHSGGSGSSGGASGSGGSGGGGAAGGGSGGAAGGGTGEGLYEQHSLNMEPTYPPRTTVTYNPARTSPIVGDVVLFHMPQNALERGCGDNPPPQHACQESAPGLSSTLALARVVGVPGDSLAFQEGNTILNGRLQHETSTKPCGNGPVCTFPDPIAVPAGAYYVLYDNRAMLDDSRVWGAIPRAAILGTVTGIR